MISKKTNDLPEKFAILQGRKFCPNIKFSELPSVDTRVPKALKPIGAWYHIGTRFTEDNKILSVLLMEKQTGLFSEVSRPPCIYNLYKTNISTLMKYAGQCSSDEYVWENFDSEKTVICNACMESLESVANLEKCLRSLIIQSKSEFEIFDARAIDKLEELKSRGLIK